MAHFAEINNESIVIRVLVTDSSMPNEGLDWLVQNLGGTWIQTSYNTFGGQHALGGIPLRKNYASVGMTYDSKIDAFIGDSPYLSWVLDKETGLWKAPVDKALEGSWEWSEDSESWLEIIQVEQKRFPE